MVGFPNNHRVFLLKMIILVFFGGTTIYGNTQTVHHTKGVAAFFSSKSAGVSVYLFFFWGRDGGHVQRMN